MLAIVLFLLTFVIPLLFVGGVVYAITASTEKGKRRRKIPTEEEGIAMLKNIYTYLVLFATLMMSIGGSVGVFMGAANYVIPDPYVEPYEMYRMNYRNDNVYDVYPEQAENPATSDIDESVVREQYDQMVKDSQKAEQRSALRLIIQSLGWIVIPLPVFMYFQKQLKQNPKKEIA